MISLDQMLEMLEAQEVLNQKYSGADWRKKNTLGQAKFALLDEVGEFSKELRPMWKWWENKNAGRQLDRTKAVYELIDIIHFALLIALYRNAHIDKRVVDVGGGDMYWLAPDPLNHFSKAIQRFLQAVDQDHDWNMAKGLFNIIETGAVVLGIHTDDLYAAYFNKNALNHERVEGGVMEGRYDKTTERELQL